jgi:hypothetical protein
MSNEIMLHRTDLDKGLYRDGFAGEVTYIYRRNEVKLMSMMERWTGILPNVD